MSNISVNYKNLIDEISGRASLVAVTKLHEIPEIEELLNCGARIVGENRVEEVERKYGDGALRKRFPGLELHLIGHLQSRKANPQALGLGSEKQPQAQWAGNQTNPNP